MSQREKPGLGELLRYVEELVERGAEETYRAMNLTYRARYTPVLRALASGAETVSEITARCRLTQGAVSQTAGLMVGDGLVVRQAMPDARKSGLRLTPLGDAVLQRLLPHWEVTFAAIDALEREIGHPLRRVLEDTAQALERQSFTARLQAAGAPSNDSEGQRNAG